VTAQGSPRTVFRRAIERGNLLMAEMAAREMGHIWLADALKLTVLAIEKAPGKRNAYAMSCGGCSRRTREIEEIVLAASALAALCGRSHPAGVSDACRAC
jgi:hypothetical protein